MTAPPFELTRTLQAALLRMLENPGKMGQRHVVNAREGTAYVRITSRYGPDKTVVPTIDLASIDILPEWQQKGIFQEVLDMVETLAKDHGRHVYAESILSAHVLRVLERRDYESDPMLGRESLWKRPSP
jgi:GNAT superfamily N-acetyltransferase